jgi:hypothetical protein
MDAAYAYGAGTSFLAPFFGRRFEGYSNFYFLCIIWAESLMIPFTCMKRNKNKNGSYIIFVPAFCDLAHLLLQTLDQYNMCLSLPLSSIHPLYTLQLEMHHCQETTVRVTYRLRHSRLVIYILSITDADNDSVLKVYIRG